jgi:hypothetical protein
MTADNRTLASATSFTFARAPGAKVGHDFPFAQTLLADLARDFGAEDGKQLSLQLKRKACLWTWEKDAS